MMRSLYSGVSGIKVHQTKMDVIGNNISNVNSKRKKVLCTIFSTYAANVKVPSKTKSNKKHQKSAPLPQKSKNRKANSGFATPSP